MSHDLRTKLIHLAHTQPEHRTDILNLLKRAETIPKQAYGGYGPDGDYYEDDRPDPSDYADDIPSGDCPDDEEEYSFEAFRKEVLKNLKRIANEFKRQGWKINQATADDREEEDGSWVLHGNLEMSLKAGQTLQLGRKQITADRPLSPDLYIDFYGNEGDSETGYDEEQVDVDDFITHPFEYTCPGEDLEEFALEDLDGDGRVRQMTGKRYGDRDVKKFCEEFTKDYMLNSTRSKLKKRATETTMPSNRAKLIHMAHKNPSLRPRLLPLLKTAGTFTEQEWKTHKENHPKAEARDHEITKGDGGKDSDKGSDSATEHRLDKSEVLDIFKDEDAASAYDNLTEIKENLNKKYEGLDPDTADLYDDMESAIDAALKELKSLNEADFDERISHGDKMKEMKEHSDELGKALDKFNSALSKKPKKEASTRTKLIRMAHKNPHLRAKILPHLKQAGGKEAMDDYEDSAEYKELVAYLERNYQKAGKGGWIAKGGGLVLMESGGEVTPWMFSMMPMHMSLKNLLGAGAVYQPATDTSPEGIVLNPHWVNINPNGLAQAASLEAMDVLKNPTSAKEIVDHYFKAIEQKAKVKIPSWIKSKYAGKAESIAARRWKAKTTVPKDTFVPFDKAYKPQSMGSMTVPRYKMGGTAMTSKERKRLDVLQKKEDSDSLSRAENTEYEALVKKHRKTPEYKGRKTAGRFSLGRLVQTRGVDAKTRKDDGFGDEIKAALSKYIRGDWGISKDKRMNDDAVKSGDDRIMGAYPTSEGDIWIITEWDRSVTTILFPSEY